jgi:hypothetical protein
MRWPSITLVVCLMLLLAAVVGGSMLSYDSSLPNLDLRATQPDGCGN